MTMPLVLFDVNYPSAKADGYFTALKRHKNGTLTMRRIVDYLNVHSCSIIYSAAGKAQLTGWSEAARALFAALGDAWVEQMIDVSIYNLKLEAKERYDD